MKREARYYYAILAVTLACLALAAGCGKKYEGDLTRARFNRIQDGMPRHDVEAILGKPTSEGTEYVESQKTTYTRAYWRDNQREIEISFTGSNTVNWARCEDRD